MKKTLLTFGVLALATTLSQAATYTWTGNANNAWGNSGNWTSNGLPNTTPNTLKDDVVIDNGDTVTRGGNLTFQHHLTVSGGSTFTFTSGDMIAKGGTVTIGSGSTLEVTGSGSAFQANKNGTVGSIFDIEGTLIASGASANPIKAPSGLTADGGFNFTTLGAKIQIDNYNGSGTLENYLSNKANVGGSVIGFFMIEGTKVTGFGDTNAVNGKYIKFTGSDTAGSLALVPEPSSATLLGLAGLALILRRRK